MRILGINENPSASKVNIDAIVSLKHASTRLKQAIDAIENRELAAIGMLASIVKRQKQKNDIMNSPRTKLHICKPRHTSRCFSLQKSSFLADAPQEIDTFVVI